MYSTQNKIKPVVADGFLGTLKNKIYNYIYIYIYIYIYSFNIKNAYIDKLADIVHKCSNTFHRTIKMKPVGVESKAYIDFDVKTVEKILNLRLVSK